MSIDKNRAGALQDATSPLTKNTKNTRIKYNNVDVDVKYNMAPTAIEAEQAIIKTLLLSKTVDAFEDRIAITNELAHEDFSDKRNGDILKIMRDLAKQHILPDFVTLNNEISKNNIKDFDITYLIELIDRFGIEVNLKEYVKIIRKKSILRQIQRLDHLKDIMIAENKPESEIIDISQKINDLEDQLITIDRKEDFVRTYDPEKAKQKIKTIFGIPFGYVSLLAGISGVGKTYTAINLACLFAKETRQKAFLWLSEDVGQLDYRVGKVLNHTYPKEKELLKNQIYFTEQPPEFFVAKEYGAIRKNVSFINWFEQNIIKKYDFIVIDPLLNFFGGDENSSTETRFFINTLQSMITNKNKIIIVVHHTNKAGKAKIKDENGNKIDLEALRHMIRGSTAIIDTCRSVLFLQKTDENRRKITVVKSNVSKAGATMTVSMPFFDSEKTDIEDFKDEDENYDNDDDDYGPF